MLLRWSAFAIFALALFPLDPAFSRDCDAHRGAGILPYAVDESGNLQVLLGYEYGRGWGGFGGGPKRVGLVKPGTERCESRLETAVREGIEETRYLVSRSGLLAALETAPRHPVAPEPGQFQTFFVRIKFIDETRFYRTFTLAGGEYGYMEKSEVAWVALDDLVQHVLEGAPLQTPNRAGLWDIFQAGLVEALQDRGQPALFP